MSGCSKTTFWGGPECRFEPRYDLGEADLKNASIKANNEEMWRATLDSLRSKTYVRDVCVKCGKTIERSEAKA